MLSAILYTKETWLYFIASGHQQGKDQIREVEDWWQRIQVITIAEIPMRDDEEASGSVNREMWAYIKGVKKIKSI